MTEALRRRSTDPHLPRSFTRLSQENCMVDVPRALESVRNIGAASSWTLAPDGSVLTEESFQRTMARERKRTERSGRPFLLMLVDASIGNSAEKCGKLLCSVISALAGAKRVTDVIGWYKK